MTVFNLDCDPDLRVKFSLIGSLYNMGMLFGSSTIGYLTGKIGRKYTILIGGLCVAIGLIGV